MSEARKHSPILLAACLLCQAVLTQGCAHRQSVSATEMDQWWYIQPSLYDQSQLHCLAMGSDRLPCRYALRNAPHGDPNKFRADTQEALPQLEVFLNRSQARDAVRLLKLTRRALTDMQRIASSGAGDRNWERTVAGALVHSEQLLRLIESDNSQKDSSASPRLRAIIDQLMRAISSQAPDEAPSGMGPAETRNLREASVQAVVRLGFAAIRRQLPQSLSAQAVKLLRESASPKDAAGALEQLLAKARHTAPPSPAEAQLPPVVRRILTWTPRVIQMAEQFLDQWDKIDYIALELRKIGSELTASAIVAVKPGKTLRLGGLGPFQPTLVFQGATRIMVMPSLRATGEAIVSFETVDGGSAEVRFEGLSFMIARLLAMPMEDIQLREIRLSRGLEDLEQSSGSVVMLGLTRKDLKDRRRLIGFDGVSLQRVRRRAFAVDLEAGRTRRTINYVTPTRRYWLSMVTLGR